MTLPKRVDLFQSKLDKEFNFKMMGVINITPNSFSDGGNFTDANSIKAQINHFRSYHCSHFDFGAESTAPFNDGISAKEEILRLSPLFDLLRAGEFTPAETLSFDTYKLDPIGRFALETADYKKMAKEFDALKLPTVICQEGGYFTRDLGDNVVSFLSGFKDRK